MNGPLPPPPPSSDFEDTQPDLRVPHFRHWPDEDEVTRPSVRVPRKMPTLVTLPRAQLALVCIICSLAGAGIIGVIMGLFR
jgi:hypothetical protein